MQVNAFPVLIDLFAQSVFRDDEERVSCHLSGRH